MLSATSQNNAVTIQVIREDQVPVEQPNLRSVMSKPSRESIYWVNLTFAVFCSVYRMADFAYTMLLSTMRRVEVTSHILLPGPSACIGRSKAAAGSQLTAGWSLIFYGIILVTLTLHHIHGHGASNCGNSQHTCTPVQHGPCWTRPCEDEGKVLTSALLHPPEHQ